LKAADIQVGDLLRARRAAFLLVVGKGVTSFWDDTQVVSASLEFPVLIIEDSGENMLGNLSAWVNHDNDFIKLISRKS